MPFNVELFKEKYKDVMSKDCDLSEIDNYNNMKTPLQKANLISEIIDKTEKNIGKVKLQEIMLKCGMKCIGEEIIEQAKTIYQNNSSIESFLKELNKNCIGGGKLELNGNIIYACYDECYCESVSDTKKKISTNYCHCSAGFLKKFFEEVLQREVNVEIIQSIINGADSCKFLINITTGLI